MTLPNEGRLRAENWRNHPQILSRLGALQSMENSLAFQENRPAVPVSVMPLGKSGLGYFDSAEGKNGAIYINGDLLMNDEPYQAVNTYFHEARHAYQHDVANQPEKHPEVETSEAELWKRNEEAYLSTEEKAPGMNLSLYEYGHYYGQPIEVDARAEAAKKTEQLYIGQFQDQQGYAGFKAQQNFRDSINEEGAQLLGDNYEEQAKETMEAKYKSLHPELAQGEDEVKMTASQSTTAQPADQISPANGPSTEAVEEAEAAGETAGETIEKNLAISSEPSEEATEGAEESSEENYQYGYGY